MDAKEHWMAPDTLGLLEDLRAASRDASLNPLRDAHIATEVPADTRAAALRLAVAIGRCRLFDVDPGNEDGTLPAHVAAIAAGQLAEALERWRDNALSLPSRFDDSDPGEAEDLCADVLEQRMTAWAALVAIEEAYEDAADSNDPNLESLVEALQDALRWLEKLDDLLTQEEFLSILSVATGSHLLDNWRALVAPEYLDPPPWWLDGTLEAVAKATAESLEAAAVELVSAGRRPGRGWFRILSVAASTDVVEDPFVRWISSDGLAIAILSRTAGSPDDRVAIEFTTRDGKPLASLSGETAVLGGLTAVVDETGCAGFTAADLAALAGKHSVPPPLVVGKAAAIWTWEM